MPKFSKETFYVTIACQPPPPQKKKIVDQNYELKLS